MGSYTSLVGKRVEAHYRAADIQLTAIGTLVSDSGKSLFVEERFSQGGKEKTMRVEIPYEFVIRVVAAQTGPSGPGPSSSSRKNS